MAFTLRNLSVLAYANGFTLWHYKAGADTLAAATSPAFFNDTQDLLTCGDIIMISASDGAAAKGVAGGSGEDIRLSAI